MCQPPSGGCVLKLQIGIAGTWVLPAAFGRLCVETAETHVCFAYVATAAFGRLCVETAWAWAVAACWASRLRAAVC